MTVATGDLKGVFLPRFTEPRLARIAHAGLGKGLGAGDAERARGGEIRHLADHRRLDTLAGAEEVDRLLRKVAGALGGDQDQGAAAIGHQATPQ